MALAAYFGKRGGPRSTAPFQLRHFRFQPKSHELHYYKSDTLPEGKSQGFIDLRDVMFVNERDDGPLKRATWSKDPDAMSYCFDLVTKDRIFHLAAATEEERTLWIQTLTEAAQRFQPVVALSPRGKTISGAPAISPRSISISAAPVVDTTVLKDELDRLQK